MELIYLWVENHKNIKNQGFNFSPYYRFELRKDAKEDKYFLEDQMTKETREKIPKNFFNKKIKNVTAIIGKNGSGKSSLLNQILYPNQENILIYKNIQNEIVVFAPNKKIEFENKNKEYSINLNIQNSNEIKNNLNNKLSVICFDNIFNPNNYEEKQVNLFLYKKKFDLSFNYRYYVESNNKKLIFSTNEIINGLSIFDLFKNDSEINNLKLKLPTFLNLNLDVDIDYFQKILSDEIKEEKMIEILFYLNKINVYDDLIESSILFDLESLISEEKYGNFLKLFNKYKDEINSEIKDGIESRIQLSVLNFIKKVNKSEAYNNLERIIYNLHFKTVENLLKEEVIEKEIAYKILFNIKNINLVEALKKILKNTFTFERLIDFKGIKKLYVFNSIIEELEESEKLVYEFKNHIEEKGISISLNKMNRNRLLSFFAKTTSKFRSKDPTFSFNWKELSTGEIAIFNMISQFYKLKKEISNDQNYLIIMDEPDTYLHPEWQRKFFNIFIDFLSNIVLEKKKEAQLILTSHSPFIASDLPKENVIMLDTYDQNDHEVIYYKQKPGLCKVVKNSNFNTFGANIFDLYKEAFFINSTFGEFSRKKIKETVELLTPSEKDRKFKEMEIEINKNKIKYIISSIGEKLIKVKLENMYYNYEKSHNKLKTLESLLAEHNISEEELKYYLEERNRDTDN